MLAEGELQAGEDVPALLNGDGVHAAVAAGKPDGLIGQVVHVEDQSEAGALANLGLAWATLGGVEEAVGLYSHALALAREVEDRSTEGIVASNLACAMKTLDRRDEAIKHAGSALTIFQAIGSPHVGSVSRMLADWQGQT